MAQKDYQSFFHKDFCGIAQLVQNVLLPALTLNQESYTNKETQPLAQQELGNANIQSAILSGTIDINGAQIDVWDVTVKPECRLHIARQAIRNCFRSYTEHYSGAFIIFHYENCANQPWRLSWLSLGKNNQDVNNAKRYTYLCGKDYACRTIAERFVELETTKTKTLDSITRAFDVEALSDEFFSEYRVLYNDIVQYITGQRYIKKNNQWECYPEKVSQDAPGYKNIYLQFARLYDNNEEQAVKAVRDYVKKLMGRLVFIQFVQKKNWLKINDISTTNFLLDIFNAVESEYRDDFIESVLEKVVYMLLNQEHTDYGKIGNVEIDVPFLNGGLFEPDIYDAGTTVRLPKEFFHNPQYAEVKRTLSDSQLRAEDKFFSQCGILDLFYQYNFTIDENDPNDAEIGVDPEMLGKIFENLLEDNKDKGAFYTHKEIVNYMCEESLIAYLNTKVPGIENAIRQWVTANENSDAINMHQKELQDALQKVKICDPAVGSGAFPMGLLNLLLRLRGTTHMTEAERCEIKKEIIQDSIYGVDIEKGAVDIARLRFWLSIVVDLDKPTALPNMDFKIMQGNSLLEWYEGVDLSGMSLNEQAKKKTKKGQAYEQTFAFDEQQSLDNIQNIIREYYGKDDHQKKVELRGIINSNVKSYIRNLKGCTPEIQQKLETLPIPNDKFFLWHIYFKEVFDNGGFDIVIGNPPYIKEYENRNAFDGFRENSPYYIGKMDLWYGFACHGIDMLTNNGVLTFIAQNNWTTSAGAKKLRNKIIGDTIIKQMVDFNEYMVFEDSASIQTMIMQFQKNSYVNNYVIDYRRLEKAATRDDMLTILAKNESSKCTYLTPIFKREEYYNGYITFSQQDLLLNKIAAQPGRFNAKEATNGIHPHYDFVNKKIQSLHPNVTVGEGIFGLSNIEKDSLGLNISELSLIKPYYTADQVKRYYTSPINDLWIIYTTSEFKNPRSMDNMPNLKRHLDRFDGIISSDNRPYGLHRARQESFFKGEKIAVLRKCVGKPSFSYSDFDCYLSAMFYILKTNRWNMKFLTGLLNSKLIMFWLKSRGKMQGENFQLDKEPLLNIPLPPMNCKQKEIICQVDKILENKRQNPQADISAIEHEIDCLVYELYGLTEEEIAIVEGTK